MRDAVAAAGERRSRGATRVPPKPNYPRSRARETRAPPVPTGVPALTHAWRNTPGRRSGEVVGCSLLAPRSSWQAEEALRDQVPLDLGRATHDGLGARVEVGARAAAPLDRMRARQDRAVGAED